MDEAVVLMQFIAKDKKNERLNEELRRIQDNITALNIQHGDPNELRNQFIKALDSIGNVTVTVLNNENNAPPEDDDLPDFDKLERLKEFKKSHKLLR